MLKASQHVRPLAHVWENTVFVAKDLNAEALFSMGYSCLWVCNAICSENNIFFYILCSSAVIYMYLCMHTYIWAYMCKFQHWQRRMKRNFTSVYAYACLGTCLHVYLRFCAFSYYNSIKTINPANNQISIISILNDLDQIWSNWADHLGWKIIDHFVSTRLLTIERN